MRALGQGREVYNFGFDWVCFLSSLHRYSPPHYGTSNITGLRDLIRLLGGDPLARVELLRRAHRADIRL